MTDPDAEAAQANVDEQAQWGEGLRDKAIRRLVTFARRVANRLETLEANDQQARDAIVALRARVKALEDAAP